MLVIGCQTIEKVFARLDSKGVWILGEVAVLEHVVDVIPNRFEGDTEFPVVVHHILGLTPVLVALYPKSAHNSETIRGALISDRDLYGHWPGEIHTQRHWWKPKPQ